ncbi:MAG: S-layer homology domain-containing protein [Oscillospiraceae bacterium]|nr:S-layer homology domain-containing protein [Oscillospiraceae bacterium]
MIKIKTNVAMVLSLFILIPFVLNLKASATVASDELTVNKVTIRCDIGDTGLIQISLSDEQSKRILDNTEMGSLVFDLTPIKFTKGFDLTFDPRAFENARIEEIRIISFPDAELRLDANNLAQLADRASGEKMTLHLEYLDSGTSSQPMKGVELSAYLKDGTQIDQFGTTNPINITIPYDDFHYNKADLVAVKTSDKENETIARSMASEKSVILLADRPGKYIITHREPKKFDDLTEEWMSAPVNLLSSRKITLGVSEHSFAPNQGITYAEFLTLFARLLNLPKGTSSNMEIPAWAKDTLTESNIAFLMQGNNGMQLEIRDILTRQEMFAILSVYISVNNVYFSKTDKPLMFADMESIDEKNKYNIDLLSKMGLIQGDSNNNIRAKDAATRAEAVLVLYKFLIWSINR